MPRVLAATVLALVAVPGLAQTSFSANEAMRQAYAHRASMAASLAKLEAARRNALSLGAYPATKLDVGRDLFNKTDIMGSADLLLTQPIDIFGKFRASQDQGRAGVATAQAAFRQAALDLQQEVLTGYANYLSAQRLLTLAKTQRELAERVRVLTAKRVQARELAEVQETRAALEVQRADGVVADRQAEVDASRIRLSAALGLDGFPAETALSPFSFSDGAASDSPEVLFLRADVAQAAADQRAASKSLLPDLSVEAGRNTFNEPARYGARLQLTMNLWDYGANRNRVRAAFATRRAADLALADRLRVRAKEIDAAQVEFAAARRSVGTYGSLASGAEELLRRTQRGFELGASTLVDVLDARRALSDAQELTINAQLREDLAVEALLRAQGRLLEEPK